MEESTEAFYRSRTCRNDRGIIVGCCQLPVVGGEGGIRTHGRGNRDTRSPGVPVRPLQHLSAERVGFEPTLRYNRRPLFESGTINHSDTSPEASFQGLALHNVILVNNLSITVLEHPIFNRLIILWRYQFIKAFRGNFCLDRLLTSQYLGAILRNKS